MLFAADSALATFEVNRHEIASQRRHGDLHPAAQVQHQVQHALLLDAVVRQGSLVFELASSDDRSLLVGMNVFIVLDLGLDVVIVKLFLLRRCSPSL